MRLPRRAKRAIAGAPVLVLIAAICVSSRRKRGGLGGNARGVRLDPGTALLDRAPAGLPPPA